MTAKITKTGDQSKLVFEYSTITEKIDATAEDATHLLFDRGSLGSEISLVENELPPAWKDVTIKQKLSILDDYIKAIILGLAKEYYLADAKQVAQISAETTIETRYI